MEAEGLITRLHGKVMLSDRTTYTYALRSKLHSVKKQAIAKAAMDLIRDVTSITLDAGTTTELIAQELLLSKSQPRLNIVTNSLGIAQMLSSSAHDLSLAGGIVLGQSACCVGPDTEEYLSQLRTEIAFVGCTCVRPLEGLCTGLRLEASVKQAMIRSSNRVVAVFDDSKWFNSSIHMFCDFSSIDTIITTRSENTPPGLEKLQEMGVEIIYADDRYKDLV